MRDFGPARALAGVASALSAMAAAVMESMVPPNISGTIDSMTAAAIADRALATAANAEPVQNCAASRLG